MNPRMDQRVRRSSTRSRTRAFRIHHRCAYEGERPLPDTRPPYRVLDCLARVRPVDDPRGTPESWRRFHRHSTTRRPLPLVDVRRDSVTSTKVSRSVNTPPSQKNARDVNSGNKSSKPNPITCPSSLMSTAVLLRYSEAPKSEGRLASRGPRGPRCRRLYFHR
jgi:hypothetical protein